MLICPLQSEQGELSAYAPAGAPRSSGKKAEARRKFRPSNAYAAGGDPRPRSGSDVCGLAAGYWAGAAASGAAALDLEALWPL